MDQHDAWGDDFIDQEEFDRSMKEAERILKEAEPDFQRMLKELDEMDLPEFDQFTF